MRLWLSERERRPDPEPARADARKAVAVGTAGWILVLVAVLIWGDALPESTVALFVPASIIGIVIGLVGLVVVQIMRSRETATQPPA